MQPLVALVEKWRKRVANPSHVPDFDPVSGGVNARALLLYEAAGPKAVESGFASIDNNDESAANTFRTFQAAGLRRELTLNWNIVPWYLGDGKRIRAANTDDLRAASDALGHLIGELPRLDIVLLVGTAAQNGWDAHAPEMKRALDIRRTWHPSNRNKNSRPAYWAKWCDDIQRLARDLG